MSRRSLAARWALSLCLCAGLSDAAAADTEIAREGQSCPDTGGGTFWQFEQTRITDAGSVAFYALCRFPGQGTWSPRGLFLHDGVTLRKLVMTLDPAPGPPGAYFDPIIALSSEVPAVNQQGEFVFEASIRVPPVFGWHGLFQGGPTGIQELVRYGDPLPPPLTGTFFSFQRKDLNDAGELVFEATLSSTFDNGLFRISNGQISVVASEGTPVPGGSGELWGEFGTPTINSHGDIAFRAFVPSQPGAVALVRDGITQLVVRAGDTAPGTGGLTFTGFNDRVAIDDAGGVVFLADVGHGYTQGVFRYADGEVTALALRDTKAPFPGGMLDYLQFQPSVSRSGRVVMPVYVESDTGQFDALIEAGGTQIHAVRLAGDPAPGGGTYVEFKNVPSSPTPPSIDSLGIVAFNALLDDGTNGVFLASPGAQVPALPPPAWLGGAAALLLFGCAHARRARRRS